MTAPDSDSGGSAALARHLANGGFLGPGWHEAFTRVSREDFIPPRIWVEGDDGWYPIERAADPARWHSLVHSDVPLVTQVEDPPGPGPARVPTSSASMPRVVATMLRALDVHDTHHVLEIGTGTGYNAALLTARLGGHHVTTVEIDAHLADAARAALKTAGYTPTVVTADGAQGRPEAAPYHRIVVTCALGDIPHPLLDQTVPGGLIVTPWGTGLYNGVLLRLTVEHGPHGPVASGPVIGDSAFMWLRAQAPRRDVMAVVHDEDDATTSRTRLDPRDALGDDDAAFTAGVMVPRCRHTVGHGPDGEWTLWLADATTGSWACLDYTPDATDYEVQQHGPRHLWTEIETAHTWWQSAGAPRRTRYGVTTTHHSRTVWLDRPDNPLPTPDQQHR